MPSGDITNLPESGDLCGNITECGVTEDHLPYRIPNEGCFVFISCCPFKIFKRYNIIYYCIYLLKSQCRNKTNCNTSVTKTTL